MVGGIFRERQRECVSGQNVKEKNVIEKINWNEIKNQSKKIEVFGPETYGHGVGIVIVVGHGWCLWWCCGGE